MLARLFSRDIWPLAAMMISAAMLLAAHAFETFGRLYPCPLCLRQREIYWAALGIGLVGFVWRRYWPSTRAPLVQCLLLGATFLTGVFVAGFHAGVEWGIFTSDCTAAPFDVGRFDPSALERPMATGACDKAPFVILGLSMAGWNAVILLGLSCASFFAASGAIHRRSSSAEI